MPELEIDGSYGEGGGQLLRTAVALSAVTGRRIAARNIRAGRDKPGLAPQHLTAVRVVAALCSARVEGLELRSQALRFAPHALSGGEHRFDVGTAGSVTLVLQAVLPAMVSAGRDVAVTVTGGTDVRQAPTIDYFAGVLLPLLARAGIAAQLEVVRRGYYPRGGGEVRLTLTPGALRPISLVSGGPVAIEGRAHVANLPEHIAMRGSSCRCSSPRHARTVSCACRLVRASTATQKFHRSPRRHEETRNDSQGTASRQGHRVKARSPRSRCLTTGRKQPKLL